MGAKVYRTTNIASFNEALKNAKNEDRTTVIYIQTVPERKMAGYGHAWWDVPIAEVSESESVQKARDNYDVQRKKQRWFL